MEKKLTIGFVGAGAVGTALAEVLQKRNSEILDRPAVRGDQLTIRAHRKVLAPFDRQIKNMYNALTELCIEIASLRENQGASDE